MAVRGGKRIGAGRKPLAKSILQKDISAEILAQANPRAIWNRILNSKDDRVVADAVKYLSDRVWGKAGQPIQLSGAVDISDPGRTALTDAELARLIAIARAPK